MITTARQLKDLIRNLSKKKSADAQILMRNYMMERFGERISLSEYKDKLYAIIVSSSTSLLLLNFPDGSLPTSMSVLISL